MAPSQKLANRHSTTLGRAQGGLGLLLILEQYCAMAGNIIVWTLGQEQHPHRIIFGAHLRELSLRKWGYTDYTWVVTRGGTHQSRGSAVWCNLCIAWHNLKPLLQEVAPHNLEDWGNLSLWIPHQNRIAPNLVSCRSQTQRRLRAQGMRCMQDITTPTGLLRTWNELPHLTTD